MTTIGQDEAAQAMAERDPLPQEVTYHVWTADEPAAGLQGERAEVRMCLQDSDADTRRHLATAFARAWGSAPRHVRVMREEPPERTPETVLRAMWLAYERAAQQAEAAYFAARDLIAETNAACRFTALDGRARVVRENLSRCEGSPDDMNDMGPLLARDYEARLSGARDLNAPPLE